MAPPQLAAHVPVADLGKPVLPDLLEAFGKDDRPPGAGGLQGGFREGLRPHEPLRLEARLDDIVAALAAPHDHLVGLAADEVAGGLEVGQDPLPRGVALQARVRSAGGRDVAVVAHHVHERQVVALAGGVVVVVVGRRDLDRAGAERRVDHGVGDDRDEAVDEGDPRPAADEVRVAGVVGVDGDPGVAEDRLRPRGGHADHRARLVGARWPRRPGGSGSSRACPSRAWRSPRGRRGWSGSRDTS